MSVQPFPNHKFRALDTNGNPLSGGKLYTYAAGTTTPLATYTTRAGSVANANPVILDASGEADVWTTPGVDYKFVLKTSADVTLWTVDNIPSPAESSASTDEAATDPGGRVTLTSLTPVTTADVTGATTVYYAPHKHNKVPLYDGTTWALYSISTELSQTTADSTKSPAAVANNSVYDLFVWNDSGTLRLSRGPLWPSDTARGTGAGTTELERVNGRYVNKVSISNGPAAQRGLYVGTIRSDGSAQINDSKLKRHVWNTYHRMVRPMLATDPANSWNYTLNTWRQANANTANQLDYVQGLSEDPIYAEVYAECLNASASPDVGVGIGLDSTTTNSATIKGFDVAIAGGAHAQLRSNYQGFPGIGRHTVVWLERSQASGTTAWNGDTGLPNDYQTGIFGELMG